MALAAHVARFFSLLLGALTVLSAYGTARAVFPKSEALASLAAALVAFNPQFLFISAAVNNDNLVIAASAAGVWVSVYLVGKYGLRQSSARPAGDNATRPPVWDPSGPTVWELGLLGVLAGVAALAKLSGLALAGLAGLALVITASRRATPFRTLIIWGLVTGVAMLASVGWWYGRNLILYGDPLGLQAMFDILPWRAAPPSPAELLAQRAGGLAFGLGRVRLVQRSGRELALRDIYRPEPGRAGRIDRRLAGQAGPMRRLLGPTARQRTNGGETQAATPPRRSRGRLLTQLSLLAMWVLVVVLALLTWAQMRYPQGRLLFPAMSAAAVLLALGLAGWVPRRLHGAAASVVATGLGILAVVALGRWIVPAYAAPQLLAATTQAPGGLSADFGDSYNWRAMSWTRPRPSPVARSN